MWKPSSESIGTGWQHDTQQLEKLLPLRLDGGPGAFAPLAARDTAQIVADAKPFPVIPSAPADTSDIATTAQGFLNRVGNLKLEELLKSATDMLNSVTALAG